MHRKRFTVKKIGKRGVAVKSNSSFNIGRRELSLGSFGRGRIALQKTDDIISYFYVAKKIIIKKSQIFVICFDFIRLHFFSTDKFEFISCVVLRASLPLSK